MPHETTFPEPRGHDLPESKLERYWRSAPDGVALHRRRGIAYDRRVGMTYAPTEYVSKPFTLRSDVPGDSWITNTLKEFIRVEFGERQAGDTAPATRLNVVREKVVSDDFLDRLLAASESIEFPGGRPAAAKTAREMAANVYELLCHQQVGSTKNRANNNDGSFVENIAEAIDERLRLLFVFPGFPFKDQNPFRVPHSADMPDMAEVSFLIRLHRLTQALYQVHPFGADVLVLSDGELYQEMFGVAASAVSAYHARLRWYRNRLNLQGTVSIISLRALIDRAPKGADGKSIAWSMKQVIRSRIEEVVATDPELARSFRALVLGMKWNLNSRDKLQGIDDTVAWTLLNGPVERIPEAHVAKWYEVENASVSAAYEYAAVNLMMRWFDLIGTYFPGSIRATVHAKPGQFAVARAGRTFAWNGVAWSERWPNTIDDIETRPLMALDGDVVKVSLEATGWPCFYVKSLMPENIDSAQRVLPREGWQVDDLHGRELGDGDLELLVEMGKNDPTFTWERRVKDRPYFENLLRFRQKHYRKYGFGVHGVWMSGQFAGQCGLQVLDEKQDQVEITILLGQAYKRRGLGTRLMRYLLRRATECGMTTIYGVARPENSDAVGLIEKFGWTPIGTVVHYGHEGVVYTHRLRGASH